MQISEYIHEDVASRHPYRYCTVFISSLSVATGQAAVAELDLQLAAAEDHNAGQICRRAQRVRVHEYLLQNTGGKGVVVLLVSERAGEQLQYSSALQICR